MTEKTHNLIIWTYGDGREIPPRACVDDTGRLMAFATTEIASVFATRLRDYGMSTVVYPVSSRDVAELIAFNADSIEDAQQIVDQVGVPEAQADDIADAAQWARELADRFMRKLVDEMASNTEATYQPPV
jgi:hypothetical protein